MGPLIPKTNGVGNDNSLMIALTPGVAGIPGQESLTSWNPVLTPGHYCLNGIEDYLFASEQRQSITVAASGIGTIPGDFTLPNRYGPILVEGLFADYQRTENLLEVFQSVTPAGTGALLTFACSGFPVLLTNNLGQDYRAVPGVSLLTDTRAYFYDRTRSLITVSRNVADTGRFSPLLLTYMKRQPDLSQSEIRRTGTDGNIRTLRGPLSLALVTIPGSGSVTYPASGNTILCQLPPGTRAGVRYYVGNSFTLTGAATGQALTYYASQPDALTLRYESGYATTLDASLSGNAPLYKGNITPLSAQVHPYTQDLVDGFLFLKGPQDSAGKVASLEVRCSASLLSSYSQQPVNIIARALDAAGAPLANTWLTLTTTGPFNFQSLDTRANAAYSNLRGISRWTAANNAGSGTYNIIVTCGSVSGSAQLQIQNPRTDTTPPIKIYLSLSPLKDASGLQDLYYYATDLAGRPLPIIYKYLKITLTCQSGGFYKTSTLYGSAPASGDNRTLVTYLLSDSPQAALGVGKVSYKQGPGPDTIIANAADYTAAFFSGPSITPPGYNSVPLIVESL